MFGKEKRSSSKSCCCCCSPQVIEATPRFYMLRSVSFFWSTDTRLDHHSCSCSTTSITGQHLPRMLRFFSVRRFRSPQLATFRKMTSTATTAMRSYAEAVDCLNSLQVSLCRLYATLYHEANAPVTVQCCYYREDQSYWRHSQ